MVHPGLVAAWVVVLLVPAVMARSQPAQPVPPTDWGDLVHTWLPVAVAILSAAIAGFSARLAWRSQVLGFAKDISAARRDTRSKQATLALTAFENSVARPVG